MDQRLAFIHVLARFHEDPGNLPFDLGLKHGSVPRPDRRHELRRIIHFLKTHSLYLDRHGLGALLGLEVLGRLATSPEHET